MIPRLSLDVQLIQDLLVGAVFDDGPREFQEAVAQRTLSVIDMGDNAKVAEPLHGDFVDPFFEPFCRWLLGP